jgi:hypothetical protein
MAWVEGLREHLRVQHSDWGEYVEDHQSAMKIASSGHSASHM